jgi:TonB family protein
MSDLQGMLAGPCDVVMIDLDSDEHFALEIVESIASMRETTVIVYSTRNDPDLLMNSMRAGARDLLPIPANEVEDAKRSLRSTSQGASPAVQAPAPSAPPQRVQQPRFDEMPAQSAAPQRVQQPRLDEMPAQSAAPQRVQQPRLDEMPAQSAAPQRVQQPRLDEMPAQSAAPQRVQQPRLDEMPAQSAAPQRVQQPLIDEVDEQAQSAVVPLPSARKQAGQPNRVAPDFNEWDRANLRPAHAARVEPPAPENRMRRATDVPAKSKPSPAPVQSAPAAAPRPFRPAEIETEVSAPPRKSSSKVKEDDRKQGGNSKKWVLIVAGPVVVAGLLWFVLKRPVQQNVPTANPEQAVASQPETPVDAGQPTGPITKPLHAASTGQAAGSGAQAPPAPASSEMMDAQLTAPSRISQDIKKAPAPIEAPPVGPSLGAFAGSGAPSAVFASGKQIKVAPALSAISAGVAEGMLIHKVDPIYPKFARDNHMSGTVILKAKISKTGSIEDLQTVSGPRILVPAALDAVKHWRYRPYMLDNEPVEVETTIKVDFLPVK